MFKVCARVLSLVVHTPMFVQKVKCFLILKTSDRKRLLAADQLRPLAAALSGWMSMDTSMRAHPAQTVRSRPQIQRPTQISDPRLLAAGRSLSPSGQLHTEEQASPV